MLLYGLRGFKNTASHPSAFDPKRTLGMPQKLLPNMCSGDLIIFGNNHLGTIR